MNDTKECPCKGNNLDKMIQPAILASLAKEELHGYKIIQRVAEMAMLNETKPDATGVYRYLKTMENMGFVTSRWDTTNSGAAKRIFKITKDGYECLCNWISTLEDYKDKIETFIDESKNIIGGSKLAPKLIIIKRRSFYVKDKAYNHRRISRCRKNNFNIKFGKTSTKKE